MENTREKAGNEYFRAGNLLASKICCAIMIVFEE